MDEQWLCYAYQYSVGGLLFFSSLLFAVKSGAHSQKTVINRRLSGVLIFGFFLLAAVHGLWIATALNT